MKVPADPATDVLYIGGSGRSGSTLLALLLGRCDGFIPVGELRYVWNRSFGRDELCSCKLPFSACPFWREVVAVAFGGQADRHVREMAKLARAVDRIRFVPLLARPRLRPRSFELDLAEYGDVVSRLYRSIITVSGGRVVVDSSKDPSYGFALAALPTLRLSVVHLVRDSRAVAYSWSRTKVRPEIHWEAEHMRRPGSLRAARQWAIHNTLLDLLGVRRERFLRLKYEALVSDHESWVTRVARLALLGDQPISASAGGTGFAHAVSGNPIRFDDRPITVREDDEWKESLGKRDRLAVTMLTAPLLIRYGYLSGR